jgi:hypothetical protein
MLYKGSYYAETFRSTRFKGTETLSIHKFDTEEQMEKFIMDYNTMSLDFDAGGAVPETYTMAQTASLYTLIDFRNKGLVE